MSDDIMPPAPPGEKIRHSKGKKKGFLSSMFKKKKKEHYEAPPMSMSSEKHEFPSEFPKFANDIPQDIPMGDIREKLGLEPSLASEVPEPPKIDNEDKQFKEKKIEVKQQKSEISGGSSGTKEEPVEKKAFDFSEIEEPPKITKKEKKTFREPSMPYEFDWTKETEHETSVATRSGFTDEVKPKAELMQGTPKEDFVKEIKPEEVKDFAKNLKRKEFEQKKEIKYEPDVNIEDEEDSEKDSLLSLPDEELKFEHKEELSHAPESKPAPTTETKVSEPSKTESLGAKGKPLSTSNTELKEPEPKKVPEPKPKKAKSKETSKMIKDLEKQLRNRVREEEKKKLEKEINKERNILEKERQALEKEKITVAGQKNKYEFREKQLIQEKEKFVQQKQKLKDDKAEAEELLVKLPELRKDHKKLEKGMKEFYEKIEEKERLDQEIKERQEALKQAQARLEDTEIRIREKGFSDYLEEAKEEALVSPKFEDKNILKTTHLEVYNMIDECKSLIREKNFDDAKRTYMDVRNAYNTIQLKGVEKDVLYTAVRELYDDIKLAELDSSGF